MFVKLYTDTRTSTGSDHCSGQNKNLWKHFLLKTLFLLISHKYIFFKNCSWFQFFSYSHNFFPVTNEIKFWFFLSSCDSEETSEQSALFCFSDDQLKLVKLDVSVMLRYGHELLLKCFVFSAQLDQLSSVESRLTDGLNSTTGSDWFPSQFVQHTWWWLLINLIVTVSCSALQLRLSICEKQLEHLETENTGNTAGEHV